MVDSWIVGDDSELSTKSILKWSLVFELESTSGLGYKIGIISQDWFISAACGGAIFDCSEANLKTLAARRKQFIEKIGWRMNKKGNLYFSLWDVEILYVNYCGKFDINKVFLNPLLKVVISCIVRGPGSIFSTKERTPYDGAQSTETLDVKWGLQHTTPGMIASAAVLYLQSGLIKTKASVLTIFYDEDWSEEMQEVMGALNKDTEELPLDNEERDDRGPGDDGINGEDVPGWQYGDNNIEFGLGGSQKEGKV
ncbi:hypothetical protein SERLADRAFT_404790 [Serpula lacrymans var. lacrymans S7.9]|uniref:Uncharacterized protein n=1 Tax=Serpula lacrymans var. lacrymans (strain S7.9) TaxID=578457 RepID=F8NF04_SERL9|nr:uncharacterized protein SERLADRAFT_404790 [Serpula lacrymans var. lacrymans S7.9]EGO30763.1 hypothetical protein SERLADRAFT_404790 [Serpula lacrymans var. lacrymans S7.9]